MASHILQFDTVEKLSEAAASEFVKLSALAISLRGRFNVALSGGSTPKRMYELLAKPQVCGTIDWVNTHVFWSDERYVPPTDSQSNEGMARAALLNLVPIPPENVHPMYREGGVEEAATAYEALLRSELGDGLALDLTLLGIGPDGHTASLFPGEPPVHERVRLVVAGIGHAGVSERITMTPPLLIKSRRIVFLVAGADKAAPMHRVLNGPENWDQTPSQAVSRHAPEVLWLLDKPATALLT